MIIPITYLLNVAYHRAKEISDAQIPNPVHVNRANTALIMEFSRVCANIDFIEINDDMETFEMNHVDAINICELADEINYYDSADLFPDDINKAAGQVIEAILETHSHRPIF